MMIELGSGRRALPKTMGSEEKVAPAPEAAPVDTTNELFTGGTGGNGISDNEICMWNRRHSLCPMIDRRDSLRLKRRTPRLRRCRPRNWTGTIRKYRTEQAHSDRYKHYWNSPTTMPMRSDPAAMRWRCRLRLSSMRPWPPSQTAAC